MSGNIALEVNVLRRQIEALLLEYPDLIDDEELRACMIEGSTHAHSVLERLVSAIREGHVHKVGIKTRIKDLQARYDKAERREDALRKLALQIMDAAGLRKLVLPEATISIRAASPSVVVIDEDQIPEAMWRIERKLNKFAVREAFRDGENVPGVTLSNGGEVIAIFAS
jgi:hypothetical protein